ncbi:1,3-beta-glucanosyltransferase [Podila clonocystis]|nr:1,3-beta-glucanosyltransferase [Podila clonocystis]
MLIVKVSFCTLVVASANVMITASATTNKTEGFRIPIHKNTHYRPNTRAKAYNTLKKYGHHRRISPRDFGRQPLTDVENNVEYYGIVGIGTPPQHFKLDMDTGSSDLWIPSMKCTHSKCAMHSRFDPSMSSTVTELKTPWKIAYGDGSTVSGHLAIDRLEFSEIVVPSQLIGLADKESLSFLDDVVDGVFGLGFPSLSALVLDDRDAAQAKVQGGGPISNTVLESILNHELIPAPVFGVWLGGGEGHGSDANGGDGEVVFGSIDSSRFEGEITFLPITHPKFWQVPVEGLQLDGEDLNVQGDAIIDTGTTLLVFPMAQAKRINKAIGAMSDPWQGYILPCDSNKEGTLDFVMGGRTFEVRKRDLVREKVKGRKGWCYSAVTSTPGDVMIFGDVFIRNNYCVFDVGHSAFASNRDEFLDRNTARAEFWDVDSILHKAQGLQEDVHRDPHTSLPSPSSTSSINTFSDHIAHCNVGILSGQDTQPSTAINYIVKETTKTHTGEEKETLSLSTENIPGTWLGITTHGDLVALTNYREALDYVAQTSPPKLSRGKVCGEYLVTMAAMHSSGSKPNEEQAEHWITKRSTSWETEFEGLNLLVVQGGGDRQCIGGNRDGSGMTIYKKKAPKSSSPPPSVLSMLPGSVTGVSNSVYARPWVKIEKGVQAMGNVLNDSLTLFGSEAQAHLSKSKNVQSTNRISNGGGGDNSGPAIDDSTLELAWLVLETLSFMKNITAPIDMKTATASGLMASLRERVFIPKIHMGKPDFPYGTRSSTVVLFGRESNIAVYAEKAWYGPVDPITRVRPSYEANTADGLIWWQGTIGQSSREWTLIQGQALESMLKAAWQLKQT